MGSNNHRGEISQIGDDIFINYALSLPVNEGPASTSGYFWKNPPGIYSYFIVAAKLLYTAFSYDLFQSSLML